MSNATWLQMVAQAHAMSHANKKESWTCECLACRFTKEFKYVIQNEDGTIGEATAADAMLETLRQEGYHTKLPEPTEI